MKSFTKNQMLRMACGLILAAIGFIRLAVTNGFALSLGLIAAGLVLAVSLATSMGPV